MTYNKNSHWSFFDIDRCIVLISQCKFTHALFSIKPVSHNNSFTNSILQLKIHVGGVHEFPDYILNVIRKNGSWRFMVLIGAPSGSPQKCSFLTYLVLISLPYNCVLHTLIYHAVAHAGQREMACHRMNKNVFIRILISCVSVSSANYNAISLIRS